MTTRFLRFPEVSRITGMKRALAYRLMTKGEFPKPIKISERSAAWLESDVEAWQKARIAASRQGQAA